MTATTSATDVVERTVDVDDDELPERTGASSRYCCLRRSSHSTVASGLRACSTSAGASSMITRSGFGYARCEHPAVQPPRRAANVPDSTSAW